ncbi:MAG: hypothetical protein RLZZ358_1409, partial [Bacteroidota bacterium]
AIDCLEERRLFGKKYEVLGTKYKVGIRIMTILLLDKELTYLP